LTTVVHRERVRGVVRRVPIVVGVRGNGHVAR
jgi:hypothetical protein